MHGRSASLLLTTNLALGYIDPALATTGEPPSHLRTYPTENTLKKTKVPVEKILKGLQEEYPDVTVCVGPSGPAPTSGGDDPLCSVHRCSREPGDARTLRQVSNGG